jgi:hypothetical protein
MSVLRANRWSDYYELTKYNEKIETIFSRVVDSYYAGSGAFATVG